MAKYKVLKRFKDKETKEVYEAGKEIDITKKRADEINKKLKGYLEEVPVKDDSKDDKSKKDKKDKK